MSNDWCQDCHFVVCSIFLIPIRRTAPFQVQVPAITAFLSQSSPGIVAAMAKAKKLNGKEISIPMPLKSISWLY